MYSITEIAKLSEINVETIRYYERRELIEKPIKVNNKKFYSIENLKRVEDIKNLQSVGFSLEEIKLLLEGNAKNIDKIKEILNQKIKILNSYKNLFN